MPVATDTRRTGLIAKVVDSNLNSWEDFTGIDINIPVVYSGQDAIEEWEVGHWSYRGQAAMCARTTDGAIVRVRIGNGTFGDRTVYRQIITDPTVQSQWTTWTQLYTGTHYAIGIQPDSSAGAGYRIYHSKADGVYMDNVLKIGALTKVVRIKPVHNSPGRVYLCSVDQDIDGQRVLNWSYNSDIRTPATTEDEAANYRWYSHDIAATVLEANDDLMVRLRAHTLNGGARDLYASDSLTSEQLISFSGGFNVWDRVRFLRGPSGQAGYQSFENLYLTQIGDYYYIFYNERQRDAQGNTLSNLKMPLVWSRSIEVPYYPSAPVPTGFSVWGFAGVVAFGDYLYAGGNGRVIRRPLNEDTIDITNYVLEGGYELPRDNQKGVGKLDCPNPANVLGEQFGFTDGSESVLTERRLDFGLGMRRPSDNQYTFKRDAQWWISGLRSTTAEDGRERLEIEFGDFWHRMENKFRDTYSIPGRFEWVDWQPEARNELFNYSNDTDEFSRYSPVGADENTLPRLRTVPSGDGPLGGTLTLYAGWRGENGFASAMFSGVAGAGIVFRYMDADNFYLAEVFNSLLRLRRIKGGTATTLASIVVDMAADYELSVDFRWSKVLISYSDNDDIFEEIEHVLDEPEMWTGFVGFFSTTLVEISNVFIREHHTAINTRELIRMLLAHIDEHDAQLEIDEETASAVQRDVIWGPQSDLDTPDKALRQVLTASKLNIVWLEDTA